MPCLQPYISRLFSCLGAISRRPRNCYLSLVLREDVYLWQVRSFTVKLALAVVDRIRFSLERMSAYEEHGGILIGRVAGSQTIEVTGCEFFPSAHKKGALYSLGARERERVALRGRELASRGDRPVGYFRTHERSGLFLDGDDLLLVDEAFREPWAIALLIRRNPEGAPEAGFFFRENGELDRRQPHLVFPFDSQELRARGPIESDAAPETLKSATKRSWPDKATLAWAGGAAAVSLGVVAAGLALTRVSRRPPANPLELRIQREGQALIVNWNRNAAALHGAASVSLTIEDGGDKEQLKLDRAELSDGKVQFWPQSRHVVVRMDVMNSRPVSESVMAVLGPETASPAGGAKRSPMASGAAAPDAAGDAARGNGLAADGGEYMLARVGRRGPREEGPETGPTEPPQRMQTLNPTPEPPAQTETPQPAAAVQSVTPATQSAAPAPASPVATKANEHPVEIAVSLESKMQSSELQKVMGHIPLLGHVGGFRFKEPEPADFRPPQPERTLEPKIPGYMAVNIRKTVEVSVLLSIDKTGKVKSAEVLDGAGTGLGSLAADRASSVAWEPARIGDKAVASQIVAHFRFRPGEKEIAANSGGKW